MRRGLLSERGAFGYDFPISEKRSDGRPRMRGRQDASGPANHTEVGFTLCPQYSIGIVFWQHSHSDYLSGNRRAVSVCRFPMATAVLFANRRRRGRRHALQRELENKQLYSLPLHNGKLPSWQLFRFLNRWRWRNHGRSAQQGGQEPPDL